MKNMIYHYCVSGEDCEPAFKNSRQFSSSWSPGSIDYLAEDAAEAYHDYEDGHESEWPLTFTIFDDSAKLLATRVVNKSTKVSFQSQGET